MQTKVLFKTLSLLALITTLIIACKHEPTLYPGTATTDVIIKTDTTTVNNVSGWKCNADTAYFQYDVLPVLISSCATSGCHDAITREDGYQLTDYASTIKKGISAGRASNSKLYTEIASGSMPPRSSGITMTQAQKDIIAKWINQGAKNLSCNPNFGTCDSTNVKFSTFIAPLVQNKCQGCHTGTSAGGGIKLDSYATIKTSVQSGKFWGSIVHTTGYSQMPKGSAKLPQCELNKIQAWIKRGAINN